MFVLSRFIIIAGCFSNEDIRNAAKNENNNKHLSPETLQNHEDYSSNISINVDQPNLGIDLSYIQENRMYLNNNFQQQSYETPFFHNLQNSNSYYYQNFMMRYNQIYFNIVKNLYECLPIHTVLQHQNNVNSDQSTAINESENTSHLSSICNTAFTLNLSDQANNSEFIENERIVEINYERTS